MPTGKNVPADELMTANGEVMAYVVNNSGCMQLLYVCVHGACCMVYCVAQAQKRQNRNNIRGRG